MAKPTTVRSWATPLTIGAFLLMAATGMLMFFGWNTGLTTVAHQWLSLFFLLGAGGHIVANWRPLRNHLKTRWGCICLLCSVALLAASLFTWGRVTGPQLEGPIMTALVDAPLSSLAGVAGMSPEDMVRRFNAHGIPADQKRSVRKLSIQYHVGINRLLGLVFLPDTPD
ncbi:hypothetical protein [Sphingomonas sp. PP-CC-3G-468]|uniref:hypothetical protein n=1 Tax=Sphingomonas sp. PP-CC-3G-468 TaxID=2135656 RepID=UPI0010497226|nr:hypothetical protein [Sphingomonas sp. PP-CC-3G-468]TCM00440.1 hypothetical protein C8J41_12312 [Sphingomonas sp. PP-CC-3G-468]